MKSSRREKKEAFKDKDYRHGYVDELLNVSIATQIKVLREQRGWSQAKLAEEASMLQPRISVLENVNYSSWSIKVLRKLAEAFDLVLCVSFETFGKRLAEVEKFSRESLERVSFDDDPYFRESEEKSVPLGTALQPQSQRFLNVIPLLKDSRKTGASSAIQSQLNPQVAEEENFAKSALGGHGGLLT